MCLHFTFELAKLILSLERVHFDGNAVIPDTTYPPRDLICLFSLCFFFFKDVFLIYLCGSIHLSVRGVPQRPEGIGSLELELQGVF